MRQANIKMDTQLAGCLTQDDNVYHFNPNFNLWSCIKNLFC